MIYIDYYNDKDGVKNICVATDSRTWIFATSTKGKEQAIKNLRRKMRRIYAAHEAAQIADTDTAQDVRAFET